MQIFNNGFEGSFKSLNSIVEDLTKRGTARESKLKDNLQVLTNEAQQLKEEIRLKMQQLIDAEIEEDIKAQEQISRELEKKNWQLAAVENKISAYELNLKFPGLSNSEIEKITAAIVKARQEREKKLANTDTAIQAAWDQIEALKLEVTNLTEEKAILQQPREFSIAKPVMVYVHPQFRDPKYKVRKGDYYYAFENWLAEQKSIKGWG